MKAWIVSDVSWEWCSLFHADTAGKAKLRGLEEYNLDSFIDMRAKRFPAMDGIPFTYEDCKKAGFEYENEDFGILAVEHFTNDCRCELCETG